MKTILCCVPMTEALSKNEIFITGNIDGHYVYMNIHFTIGGRIKYCPYCGKLIKVRSKDEDEIRMFKEENKMKIKIIKEADDPLCPRASIGGTEELGYYCVYRNEKEKVIKMLKEVIKGLEK